MPPILTITASNTVQGSFGFGHRVNVTIWRRTRLVLTFFIGWLFILFLNVLPSFINVLLSFIITNVYSFKFMCFLLKKVFDTLFLGRNLLSLSYCVYLHHFCLPLPSFVCSPTFLDVCVIGGMLETTNHTLSR